LPSESNKRVRARLTAIVKSRPVPLLTRTSHRTWASLSSYTLQPWIA
jgi:hypothetical protein